MESIDERGGERRRTMGREKAGFADKAGMLASILMEASEAHNLLQGAGRGGVDLSGTTVSDVTLGLLRMVIGGRRGAPGRRKEQERVIDMALKECEGREDGRKRAVAEAGGVRDVREKWWEWSDDADSDTRRLGSAASPSNPPPRKGPIVSIEQAVGRVVEGGGDAHGLIAGLRSGQYDEGDAKRRIARALGEGRGGCKGAIQALKIAHVTSPENAGAVALGLASDGRARAVAALAEGVRRGDDDAVQGVIAAASLGGVAGECVEVFGGAGGRGGGAVAKGLLGMFEGAVRGEGLLLMAAIGGKMPCPLPIRDIGAVQLESPQPQPPMLNLEPQTPNSKLSTLDP